MPVPTIEWKRNKVKIIDQTALPDKVRFIYCSSKESIWHVIRDMKIRGAPALGVAAAFGVYLGIRKSEKKLFKDLEKTIRYLAGSRPTARNLFWALERMKKTACRAEGKPIPKVKKILLQEALNVLREDRVICRKIGDFGSRLIDNEDSIITHCNAGGLATADYGTALGVLFTCCAKGKKIKVYANETRPLLQGARLTAWELMKAKIDVTLISDNAAGYLMSKGRVDKVIVGADRIARNGDTANKIGTYSLAISAHYHGIPFYVAAPLSTIDVNIKGGSSIPIEERCPDEIRKINGIYIAPKKVKVFNPAFDVTPGRFISAIITEKGILRKPFRKSIGKLFNK